MFKAGDVQRLVRGMVDRGLSPATVRRAVGALSTALSVAAEWHEVTTNVAQGVRLPRMRRAEVRVLTAEEASSVVRVAGDGQYGMCIDRDPTLRVKGPRVPRHVPVDLSAEEVGAPLRAWPGSSHTARRNRVDVLTLLDNGLRMAELCSLTVGAVDRTPAAG